MIRGIGLDLIELERIQKSVRKGNQLAKRVLTAQEFTLYANLPNERRQSEFLAGRFAAKEAFSKAAGTGIGTLSFDDIEVLYSEQGAPLMEVRGYETCRIFVSITHTEHYAAAQVVIESD